MYYIYVHVQAILTYRVYQLCDKYMGMCSGELSVCYMTSLSIHV